MQYKYKLSEMSKTAPPEEAAKELKRKPGEDFKVGQVTYSDDGLRKSVVTNINPETGAVRWEIIQLPGFETLYDELDDLVDISKRVYVKTKDDKKFREFYEEARKLRNKVRTHLRNEYPDEYKNITRIAEEDVDEISTSSGAGAYLTPYAFRLKGKKPNIKAYKELGYEEVNENKKNPGATLGPGPAASEDGVKDNYYVKAFKFKLVPKKIKDSGIIVKQLF
tara:strand:- start:989 stop:1654 length:666 start_codon:yes stop_codon:yes gene_type:complete